MSRFLIISFALNFLLFTFYGYWLGKALQSAFNPKNFVLPPLEIRVLQTVEKEEEIPKKGKRVSLLPSKGKKVVKKSRKRERRELLSEILPQVEETFRAFKRIITTAKASYGGKKFKITTSRKLVYVPKVQPLKVSYPPSPVEVRITVLPDGRVINAVLLKKSGNPKVDKFILNFVRNLRFERISQPVIQEIYIFLNFSLKKD